LIDSCKNGNLLEIGLALDCFYEVFNEDYFDAVLFETGAI
jgi:hypothetical protein